MTDTRKKSLLVLAAGMGSRYGGLKQMAPVGPGGEFMLDYSVSAAINAGFNRVVFVIRRDIEADFRNIVGRKWEGKTEVEYVFQDLADLPGCSSADAAKSHRTKPWGTGHAVLAARDILQGPFAVANADDFYGAEPFGQLSAFLDVTIGAPNLYAMVAYRLDNTLSAFGSVSRGVCQVEEIGSNLHLVNITEHAALKRGADGLIRDGDSPEVFAPDSPISMNLFAFKRSFIDRLEEEFPIFFKANISNQKAEFQMPTALGKFVRDGLASMMVLRTNAEWTGITSRDDHASAASRLSRLS